MKTKKILKGLIAMLLLTFAVSSCESFTEDVINNLDVSRVFAPINVTAKVRNQTTVELNWTAKDDVDHYIVEFSADDTEFKTIFKTVEVTGAELPVQVALEGETLYSIRVKAVSTNGLEDSKWSIVTATTLSEQLFLAVQAGDIDAKQATLRWVPNIAVTKIVLTPGDITHDITAEEKVSGVATVTGLNAETIYTANLYNNTKRRGAQVFTTGIDIGDGILVKPTDNLVQMIADAPSGSIMVLEPGDYTSQIATISLAKSITIRGLRSYDRPKLKVSFSLVSGAANVSLIDLDLTGDLASTRISVVSYTSSATYGKLLISGCNIHDYDRSLAVAASTVVAKIESITVENSIVTNVATGTGGEFIDFRAAFVGDIIFTKSTFNNVAPSRAFIREDANSNFGTALTSNVLIDSCTLYGVTNTIASSGYQILYVRYVSNATIVRNSLFAATVARYANQAATTAPTFTNNNYYNAATLNQASPTSPLKSDASGRSLDPGFANAATGDFTISNQTLKDDKVGDPRWIK